MRWGGKSGELVSAFKRKNPKYVTGTNTIIYYILDFQWYKK